MGKQKHGCCLPQGAGAPPDCAPPPAEVSGCQPDDLIALPGGWFRMGADDGPHPQDGEGPARDVFVAPFSLAAKAVSIADFAAFVAATGYLTVAERAGSSFVFADFAGSAATGAAPVQAPWWRDVAGACWNAPYGPHRALTAVDASHPVTHIARQDALAYCHWTGTRLPSEAEWEYAARGGLDTMAFPWGHELEPDGTHRCNIWQGQFPTLNTCKDGYAATAPVDSYRPNDWGFFNTVGNVWEWTADRFTTLHSPRPARNPTGPLNGDTFVAKGGSYLCHASYCERYRTSSRQELRAGTTTGNLGFRVAV